MKKLLTYLFLIASISSLGQNKTIKDFQLEIDSSGLKFEMPSGYSISSIKKNPDLWYSFAIINGDSTMEVRYTVWSLEPLIKQYEESLKDSNSVMVPPNNIYLGRIQANMLNMSGGQWYDIGAFPPAAVKKEFNADKGGSCFLEFNCEFGKGWKYGQFMYLHKDNVADAIITFMSNDKETHSDLMMIPFHSLKFK
jgi:hypothetical protein